MTHHTSADHSADELKLWQLFEAFVDAGLHGRFDEALSLLDEPYTGVGLGEQGIVKNKEDAALVLCGSYRAESQSTLSFTIRHFLVNFLSNDAAMLIGQVDIINAPEKGDPTHSGIMQTIGARRTGEGWRIGFTHASPTVLTLESVEAYPIRFLDHTLSLLKAGLQAETVLYTEVNLTTNSVARLQSKSRKWPHNAEPQTFEELIKYGLYADMPENTSGSTLAVTSEDALHDTAGTLANAVSGAVEQEYYAFWNRLRLLGLFAEGVTQDHFDYRISSPKGFVWLRSAVELVRQPHSGDIIAIVSFTHQNKQMQELAQYTHKAYHDALTGVLNRDGFENRAGDMLSDYVPQSYTALFMIDLDDFKQINDRLGHQVGDHVLQQVAGVLQSSFQHSGIVGRMGGDEFMALLTGDISHAAIEEQADILLNAMKLSMGGSKQIPVSVSIGVAYGRARTTFENLYRIADLALYAAKRAGKCRYHLINTDTSAEQGYSGTSLLSLQTLLDFSDDKIASRGKNPYEALLDNIPGGVVVMEITHTSVNITHCNDWFYRVVGYSAEEVIAMQSENPFCFIHPDDRCLIIKMIQQARDGADTFNAVYRVRCKDGSYTHIARAASTTERRQDSVLMYGIDTNVEEVVQLKQEVESSHNRLGALVDALPGGLVIITMGDHIGIRHGNNWISRSLGYAPVEVAEMEKANAMALVHPEDRPIVATAIQRMRAGTAHVHVVYRLVAQKGSYRYVRLNASFVEHSQSPDGIPQTIYYGVLTDADEASTPVP